MTHRLALVIIIFIVLPFLPAAHAAFRTYSDMGKVGARPIPYGEIVTIHGSITDFDTSQKKFSDWMQLSQLSVSYNAGSTSGKANARISTDGREWEVDLNPLPAKSILSLELTATLRPTQAKATEVIVKTLDSPEYRQEVSEFFHTATSVARQQAEGNTVGEAAQEGAKSIFLRKLGALVKSGFPPFLSLPDINLQAQPEMRKILPSLLNLRKSLDDVRKKFKKPYSQMDLGDTYLKLKESKENFSAQQEKARVTFLNDYDNATSGLQKSLTETVTQTVTVNRSLPTTSTTVEDLQKYAGIDYAALYLPGRDEIRSFILVSIYPSSVDESPPALSRKENLKSILRRLSLTVGWGIGNLGNNQNSDINGNDVYALGIGFRLNKYFRVSYGIIKYHSKTSGNLAADHFLGLSVDLTAFNALKGLVTK